MIFRHDCAQYGHRYEARFDLKAPAWLSNVRSIQGHPKETYESIYVHDICTRCGDIKKRNP